MKSFYFLRHGETDWNLRRIYTGSQDIPLNQTGIEQAKHAARWLVGQGIEHIATSPLTRTLQTAEIIAEKVQKPITVINDLKEFCWGAKEGRPVDNCTIPEMWERAQSFEGVEKIEHFQTRVSDGFRQALQLPSSVLIVSHGGVYCAIQKIINVSDTDAPNCVPIYHRPPEHSSHPWFVCDLEGDL